MAAKFRTGDQVIVITGRDKGRIGEIKSFSGDDRALVSNVNMVKKSVKGDPNRQIQGGIIEKEAPIQLSNVALVDPKTGKRSKVGFRILADGKKVRYFKSTNEVIEDHKG